MRTGGQNRETPTGAATAGFAPRLTHRPLADRIVTDFPAASILMARLILRLPPGHARRRALSWMIHRAYAAYDRGDAAVTFAVLADDVEWHLPADFPGETEVLHGRDAVIAFYGDVLAEWDHRIRVDAIDDHGGGRVSVHATNVLTSSATGLTMQLRDIDEIHFRRGRIALVRERLDDAQGNPWRGLAAETAPSHRSPGNP